MKSVKRGRIVLYSFIIFYSMLSLIVALLASNKKQEADNIIKNDENLDGFNKIDNDRKDIAIAPNEDFELDSKDDIDTPQLDKDDKIIDEQNQDAFAENIIEVANESTKTINAEPESDGIHHPRIYCMVPTKYPDNISNINAILKTWGKDCDVLKFFVDPPLSKNRDSIPKYISDPDTGVRAEFVIVDMVRQSGENILCSDGLPCRHIWEKVWRSWTYVHDNDIHLADWFSKIDDDTFNILPNLREYIAITKKWTPDDVHYFGHWVDAGDKILLISGVFSTLSKAALKKAVPVFKSMPKEYGDRSKFERGRCVDRDGATEEKTFSKCLTQVDVHAESTHDNLHNGCERVIPLGLPFMLTYKRKKDTTSWFWAGKPWTRGDRNNCCCFDAYAIHGYKSGSRMIQMHEIMYEWSDQAIQNKMKENKEKIGPNRSLIPESKEAIIPAHDEYWFFWYISELRQHLKQNPFSKWKEAGNVYPKKNWKLMS